MNKNMSVTEFIRAKNKLTEKYTGVIITPEDQITEVEKVRLPGLVGSDSCPYCQLYIDDHCECCPMNDKGNGCTNTDSTWSEFYDILYEDKNNIYDKINYEEELQTLVNEYNEQFNSTYYETVVNYFNKHNYGLSNDPKVNEARFRIYTLFDVYNSKLSKICKRAFLINLKNRLPDLEFLLKYLRKDLSEEEYDIRSGEETYGYNDIWYDLSYIEDRWMCEFRIQWMIDIFNEPIESYLI